MRRLTRRRFLQRAGAAALGTAGIYGLVDGLAAETARALALGGSPRPEQHVLHGVRVLTDNGVQVVVPPIHHQVVTAVVHAESRKASLLQAQRELEAALAGLDRAFTPTPAGLGVTVAWGRPYFRRYVPGGRLPLDRRASRAAGKPVAALTDAVRFPSDPHDLVLEQNDVCILFRSDSLDHIAAGADAVFGRLDGLFELTSVRKGFVGGGLPRKMAIRAGIRGAESIPLRAQLFLGFTSTQKSALGPDLIANLETLPGLTDQWPNGYFRHGTTMHLSHLYEDLETWYERFTYNRRVWAAFRPGLSVPEGTLTVPGGPRRRRERGGGRLRRRYLGAAAVRAQRRAPAGDAPHGGDARQLRRPLPEGHGADPARGLQHPRQPVLLELEAEDRPARPDPGRRPPLRGLLADERLVPPRAHGDGRPLPGRDRPSVRPARRGSGLQLGAPHDPQAELPRPAAAAPVVPAGRAALSRACLSRAGRGGRARTYSPWNPRPSACSGRSR